MEHPEFQQLATKNASSCHPMLEFAGVRARLCRTLLAQMLEFVILSSELLDCQAAEEVDELSCVLPKDFGRTPLALLGWCQDEHIDVTVPERLLVLVPGFHLLAARFEMVDDLKDTANEA